MLSAPRYRGFTLIELMIALVILGILVVAGFPSITTWLQNTQIRNAAEAALAGLQLTRTEATRRNTSVAFSATNTDPVVANVNGIATTNAGRNWMVRVFKAAGGYTASDFIQGAQMTAPNSNAVLTFQGRSGVGTVTGTFDTLVFNSLGRITNVTDGGAAFAGFTTLSVDITNPNGGACHPAGPMRCLRVQMTVGGRVRMCDPSVAATDLRACL